MKKANVKIINKATGGRFEAPSRVVVQKKPTPKNVAIYHAKRGK